MFFDFYILVFTQTFVNLRESGAHYMFFVCLVAVEINCVKGWILFMGQSEGT